MRYKISQDQIVAGWKFLKPPKVSIVCITYNHLHYIEDALNGFLMQKTGFPFEIVIHDDASTDGTSDIIRAYEKRYPKIIRAIYQEENQYSKKEGSILSQYIFPKCRGEYIALCEGDDYWSDPIKLKSQVNIMENSNEISLTFHAAEIVHGRKFINEFIRESNHDELYTPDAWGRWGYQLPTASICFRTKYIRDLPVWVIEAPVGDMPLRLFLSQMGNVYYLNKVMSIRRLGVVGSWSERMTNELKASTDYYGKILKMYENFDYFTKGIYHRKICYKILIHKIIERKYSHTNAPLSIFIKSNYKLFRKLKFNDKFAILLFFVLPAQMNYLKKLMFLRNNLLTRIQDMLIR